MGGRKRTIAGESLLKTAVLNLDGSSDDEGEDGEDCNEQSDDRREHLHVDDEEVLVRSVGSLEDCWKDVCKDLMMWKTVDGC